MDPHLVSFKTCPYVQRSVITLKEKGVPFKMTYIDLADPPQWFNDDSPLGKVPILKTTIEGKEQVLFESAAINEFVDEVTEGSLMPTDPWDKAQARAWFAFGGDCNTDYYLAYIANDQAGYEQHRDALLDKLGRLEQRLVGPFFFGAEFTLADAAFAPLLMRMGEFEKFAPGFSMSAFPRLQAWNTLLESRPAVAESMVPEWRELMMDYLHATGGYLAANAVAA
jgi:glutathione S-transferase